MTAIDTDITVAETRRPTQQCKRCGLFQDLTRFRRSSRGGRPQKVCKACHRGGERVEKKEREVVAVKQQICKSKLWVPLRTYSPADRHENNVIAHEYARRRSSGKAPERAYSQLSEATQEAIAAHHRLNKARSREAHKAYMQDLNQRIEALNV